jgi:phospholipid/cholesterol/gamma-HCH transport system substrate-binding protein
MKKIFSKEVKIGIAFIAALFILYYGINFLKGINIFKPTNSYIVVFDDVTDLSLSSPVLLNGYKVGLVYSMELINTKDQKIAVTVNLDKGVKIPTDSKVKLDISLMGNASVIIDKNPYTTSYYNSNDTLQGIRIKGLMESMSATVVPQVTELVPKLDSIMSGLQTIVNHPALTKSLDNIEIITSEMTATTRQLNQMMATLNKDIPTISNNMSVASNDLTAMTGQFKSMDFISTYNSVDSTLKNVQDLTTKLNSKNSSLGLLLNDRQLYDSLNVTIGNASQLLKDVKENPSKYINVKVF